MKNVLNFYYNLNPENIHQNQNEIFFSVLGHDYLFVPTNKRLEELNELASLSSSLYLNSIPCHQFVLNINSSVITQVNNKNYVLLAIINNDKKEIKFSDVINFSNINVLPNSDILIRNNWYELWTEKVDYFEYQVNQFGKTFPLIRESFCYYAGLAETAITLLKNNLEITHRSNYSISHRRIKYKFNFIELYNPLNFVIDYKVRDIAEYIKSAFFNEVDLNYELIEYINNYQLTSNECILLFARLLFPTFYFDIYEQIISGNINEEKLLYVIKKTNDYEMFLKKIYFEFRNYNFIPEIEWLMM